MLGEGPTDDINGSIGTAEKILLESALQCDNSCLFVNGKETYKFKVENQNVDFLTQFCPGNITN